MGGGFQTLLQKPYCNFAFPRWVKSSLALRAYSSFDAILFHIRGYYYIWQIHFVTSYRHFAVRVGVQLSGIN